MSRFLSAQNFRTCGVWALLERRRLHQEITILLQLKHQHIVKLVDFARS